MSLVQDTELMPSTEDSSSLHVVVHRAFDLRAGSGSGSRGAGASAHSFADPLGATQTAAAGTHTHTAATGIGAGGPALSSVGAPPLLSARFVFDDYIVRRLIFPYPYIDSSISSCLSAAEGGERR